MGTNKLVAFCRWVRPSATPTSTLTLTFTNVLSALTMTSPTSDDTIWANCKDQEFSGVFSFVVTSVHKSRIPSWPFLQDFSSQHPCRRTNPRATPGLLWRIKAITKARKNVPPKTLQSSKRSSRTGSPDRTSSSAPPASPRSSQTPPGPRRPRWRSCCTVPRHRLCRPCGSSF